MQMLACYYNQYTILLTLKRPAKESLQYLLMSLKQIIFGI